MTDVSASNFAEVYLREASAPATPRRQAPPKQPSATLRRETARQQPAPKIKVEQPLPEPSRGEPSRGEPSRGEPSRGEPSRAQSGRAEPQAALAASVLEWLRQTPGHWRGRAFARRELASTAYDDAEQREHLAMADLYDRLSLSREAVSRSLPVHTEIDRWRWRPDAAASIPADIAADGLWQCLVAP